MITLNKFKTDSPQTSCTAPARIPEPARTEQPDRFEQFTPNDLTDECAFYEGCGRAT
jgi:hypothetical protein